MIRAGLLALGLLLQQGSALPGLVSRAQEALKAHDYASAQSLLEQAVAMRPNDPEIRYMLGRSYGEDKKYQAAVKAFKEVLGLAPGHAAALIDLASIEESTGKFQEAGDHYREALKNGPNAKAERGLASLLSRQGKTDEGIAILQRLTAADPADVESRYQLGLVLMQKGDCAGAVTEFDSALKLQAEHPGALFNLGNCLNRVGRKDEAAAALAKFQEVSRRDEARVDRTRRGYFLLLQADQQVEKGDAAGAVKSLREAITLNPDDPKSQAMLGQVLDETGDFEGALAAYKRASELDPDDPFILVETGRLFGRTGRMDDAIVYLKKAAEVAPAMPEPHMLLAAAYQQLGRTAEAAAAEATWRRLSQRKGAPPVDPKP